MRNDSHGNDLQQRLHHINDMFLDGSQIREHARQRRAHAAPRSGRQGQRDDVSPPVGRYPGRALYRIEQTERDDNRGPDLPRTGKELEYVVQILLKTNEEDKRSGLKHFIHQAIVNRRKVVNAILAMKRRGHRAYVHVDETKVIEKSQTAS